jgi:hypothetical protein
MLERLTRGHRLWLALLLVNLFAVAALFAFALR